MVRLRAVKQSENFISFIINSLIASRLPSSKASPGKQLRAETQPNKELSAMLKDIQEEAKTLDLLINVIGCFLPPQTKEVVHNSDHHFVNPITKFNVSAQLSILLALICYAIVGISNDAVNLILAFVNAIIQSTMALYSHSTWANPMQEYLLQQLPTSLKPVLCQFKIHPMVKLPIQRSVKDISTLSKVNIMPVQHQF
ncbi:unnamed protein product [Mycena citricolor]|uniref:Uncharacterized protein n=1 Tax=Mycena citricolor TaxID=2018698 RepID=A0AAD2Q541_9AGAR|nr:unnamed protein product [Mycena citricolor]